MSEVIFDYDFIKFEAACLAEKRSIKVIEKKSGNEYSFKNRTEFYGNYLKKNGGWLAEYNKSLFSPLLPEDFIIEDVQEALPISHAKKVVETRIDSILDKLDKTSYHGYIGKGKSFREDVSTIVQYKGNRTNLLKPLLLDEVGEYIHKKHDGEYVTGIEADDQCVISCHNSDKILACVDKDYMGCEITVFNPDTMDSPLAISGVGKLWIDDKKKVRGYGRKWLYHQVMSGDSSDNYFANSASDKKWGEKSSYNLLSPCKTDKECLEALVEGYKILYPEPREIIGWRGDKIRVDWLYVLKENFQLARMLRWEGDNVDIEKVMNKLGVNY